jgi:hypothetical protein
MHGTGLGHLSGHWDVFKQLGDREPTTAIEAQAVIENIRAEKGHLDDQAVQEVNTLSRPVRETILRIVELKRETEAAYTTKYDPCNRSLLIADHLAAFRNNCTRRSTASCTSWCRMRMTLRIKS